MNYIFTWASGEKFLALPEVDVYFKSLKKHVDCRSVVFTHDMPDGFRKKIESKGHEIIDVPSPHFLMRDRHFEYYKHIRDHLDLWVDNVLFCDCKDVVFQRDVFKYIQDMDHIGHSVYLCDEGMKQHQSEWNAVEQLKLRQQLNGPELDFMNSPVLNGGFILGEPEIVGDFAFLIWSTTLLTKNVTDQALINYWYLKLKDDGRYRVLSPIDSNYVVTGEAIKEGHFTPLFENGLVLHPENKQPYCAFHQWDRTVYKDEILSGYLND